jgi:hypothetical protein
MLAVMSDIYGMRMKVILRSDRSLASIMSLISRYHN